MTLQEQPSEESWLSKLYAGGLIAFAIFCNFSISLSQISLGLALIGAFFLHRNGQLELKKAPIKETFLFFALTGVLSIFQAEDKIRAITELKKFLIILVFYLAWWPKMKDDLHKKIITVLIATATLTAILSLADVAMGKMLNDRAKGFFSTAITFGECQAMVSTVILTWLLIGGNSWKQFSALLGSLFLVSGSMISTMSRGSWLGFLIGMSVLVFRFPRKMLPIVIILGLVTTPIILSTPSLRARLESLSISKNLENMNNSINGSFESAAMASNFERLTIWTRGFEIAAKHSNFGVGMNNVKQKYFELASDYERQNSFLIYGHQHNNFMQFFAMTGLIGLTAFFIFLVSIFKFFFQKAKFAQNSWHQSMSLGAAAVFMCFIATGLSEYSWGDEEVAMMAFFVTGLMMNKVAENDTRP
jgi:O-antigen ligase